MNVSAAGQARLVFVARCDGNGRWIRPAVERPLIAREFTRRVKNAFDRANRRFSLPLPLEFCCF
jgi:hypothetical protein